MAFNAKLLLLLLLLLHVFSVFGNQLSRPAPSFILDNSLQENYQSQDDGEVNVSPKKLFNQSFRSGFTIGYVLCSVSVITIFLSYCVPWAQIRKGNNRNKKNKVIMAPMMTSLMARRDRKRKGSNLEIAKLEKLIKGMSFSMLHNATNSFDQDSIIGLGKMGIMYKGIHPYYGYFVAVKRLRDSQHLEKRFMSELRILSRFRHINIVVLLGFCIESWERLLVYQYMPNGNLYDWLHPVKGKFKARILDWHLRVKIAVGVARGLAWLHNNKFPMVHLNISSRCILLDRDFEPKISNFGYAMSISSNASDLLVNSGLHKLDLIKKDVYKFGILLLELILEEDPVCNSNSSRSLDTLVQCITQLSTRSSSLDYTINKSLIGEEPDHKILHFLKVASNCIQPLPYRRPTMLEVYNMLITENSEMLAQQGNVVTTDSSDHCVEFEITE